MNDPILEAVAEQCHKQWSGLTTHLLGKLVDVGEAQQLRMPLEWVTHWQRQIETAYADLTEEEREADRREARKILAAIEPIISSAQIPESVQGPLDHAEGICAPSSCVSGDAKSMRALAEAYRSLHLNMAQVSHMNADFAQRERESLDRAEKAEEKLKSLETALNVPGLPLYAMDTITLLKSFWKDAFVGGLNIHAWRQQAEYWRELADGSGLLRAKNQGIDETMAKMGPLLAKAEGELAKKTALLDAIQQGATVDSLMPVMTWYDELKGMHSWNFEVHPDGVYGCRNNHHPSQDCKQFRLNERQTEIYEQHLSDIWDRK